MQAVLVAVPTAMQNSLHPLSTFSNTAHHLLDFMLHGKITEADVLDYRCPHLHHPALPIFMRNAHSAATLSIYLGLGLALNNAGLYTQWLGSIIALKCTIFDLGHSADRWMDG